MRISELSIFNSITASLQKASEDMFEVSSMISAGKKINDLSDDPQGMSRILSTRSALRGLKQTQKNMVFAKSWLTAGESALKNTEDLIGEAKIIAVQMASDTVGGQNRSQAAKEIENILDSVLSIANTDMNGRYIFSGTDTTTPAFNEDGGYAGNDRSFRVPAGNGEELVIGGNGDEIFSGLISSLKDLKDALENNEPGGIREQLDRLDDALDNISGFRSDFGSRLLRVEMKERLMDDLEILKTEALSDIEDVDIAEAMTMLKSKELAYQAALSSSSKIMSLSLLDYIK